VRYVTVRCATIVFLRRATVCLGPIAVIPIFNDNAQMLPFVRPAPHKTIIVLAAIVAFGACRSEQEFCINSERHWAYRPLVTEPVVDVVLVTRSGALKWNGKAISQPEFSTWLNLKGRANATPTMLLRHEYGADCSTVAAARALISKSLDCASGQCAEGHEWDSIPENGFNGFDGGRQKPGVISQ
jgi:hypothetical protein